MNGFGSNCILTGDVFKADNGFHRVQLTKKGVIGLEVPNIVKNRMCEGGSVNCAPFFLSLYEFSFAILYFPRDVENELIG